MVDGLTRMLQAGCMSKTCVSPIFSEEDSDLAAYGWSICGSGYPKLGIRRLKNVPAHRIVLERMIGRKLLSTEFCDHINGIKLDARRKNLRLATRSDNRRNLRKCNAKSGFFGVVREGNRWKAQIVHCYIGLFDTKEAAALAYNAEAARIGVLTRNTIPLQF